MSSDQLREFRVPARGEETSALPDVAADIGASDGLDWVGMDAIELPLRLVGRTDLRMPARVSAQVDLREGARGIHMSRLYLALDAQIADAPLSPALLESLLREFVASHAGLSTRARVRIDFDQFLRRAALASGNCGWRRYPVTLTASLLPTGFTIDVAFAVVYSSTCPASTALARQLVAEDFAQAFAADEPLDRDAAVRWLAGQHGMRATPHSQRSTANIRARLLPGIEALPLQRLIDGAEGALATPVQAAVKRIDEQAFARANGVNPMFCEDAARRLRQWLQREPLVSGFHVRVAHHESLHAHDAVAEFGAGRR